MLVTDSNSQLPPELAQRWGVRVVPVTVTIDGVEYLEGETIDADGFWAHYADGAVPQVSTSQPSPGAFIEAYRGCIARGADEIVSIHVAESLSGTLNSARLASGHVEADVHLVDTGTASFGIACAVWEAHSALAAGGGAVDAIAAAQAVSGRLFSVTAVGAADLLTASGRAAGFEASIEGVDLFVTDPSGGFDQIGAAHTADEVCDRLADTMRCDGEPIRVAIGIGDRTAAPYWQGLEARLAVRPDVVDVVRYRIGPSVGAFVGPGTAGGFWYPVGSRGAHR